MTHDVTEVCSFQGTVFAKDWVWQYGNCAASVLRGLSVSVNE